MIAVIGCGRVGLPLALLLADRGQSVLGIDSNERIVARLRAGEMPFADPYVEPLLPRTLDRTFHVTSDLGQAVAECDAFIITVGTPLDGMMLPDQAALFDVVARVMDDMVRRPGRTGPTLIIRSTVLPGTTQGLIRQFRDRLSMEPGRDYAIAYCPERTLEGQSAELLELPQIIGAPDRASEQMAAAVFSPLGVRLVVTGPTEAELAKLSNNAYRYVNFALANELMMISAGLGVSVHEVVRAANDGYRRGGIAAPGYAAGPCLYKDGFFLNAGLGLADLLLCSWKVNESLPEFFIQEVERIRPLVRPVVLGLAFKADSDDTRNSLGIKLLRLLRVRGLEAPAHDPRAEVPGVSRDLPAVLAGASEVFVTVPHREYRDLEWTELLRLVSPHCVIADPWRVWGQDPVVEAAHASRLR